MALGNMARLGQTGQAPQNAVFHDIVTLVGESSYAAGGSTGLQTKLRALTGAAGRTVKAVVALDGQGYVLGWDVADSKLKVYYGNYDAADGALIEVPNATDLSGVTFTLLVISE